MKPSVSHLVALMLYLCGQGVQYLQTNPALSSELHIGAQALTFLAFVVALASSELFGTKAPPAPLP